MVSIRICLIFLEGVSSVSALLLSEVKLFLSGFPPLTFAREKKNKKKKKIEKLSRVMVMGLE